MVQQLKRLFGKADIRILSVVALLTIFVTIGWTVAQLSDDSNTTDTWTGLVSKYLEFRDSSYMLAVPSWYLYSDQIESIESTYGLAGFQNQSDFYVDFNAGDIYFSAKSEIAKQIPHGTKLVFYEDITTGELLVMRDTGEAFEEEIVFKAPEWPELNKTQSTKSYLYREISKRRVAWHVTLKDKDLAEEEYQDWLAALEEDEEEFEGGGMMMMLMGGEDELAIAEMKKVTNGLLLNLEYTVSFSGTVWSAFSYDTPACVDTNFGGGGGGDPPPPGTNECTNCMNNCAANPTNSFMGLERVWTLVYTNLLLTGETFTAWTDTRPMGFDANTNHVNRFYAFGNNGIDTDEDGLNDALEMFTVKSNPEIWDTDGDGVGDGEEWTNGTSPNNPHDPPNVKGSIFYNGQQTNVIRVLVVTDSNSWSLTFSTTLTAPGNFQIANLPISNYWLKAFRDLDGDSTPDSIEAFGEYIGNPLSISNQVTGIEIILTELDSDGDGFSDYEEAVLLGTNPSDSEDGLLVLETARSKVIAHANIFHPTPLVFTNALGSHADLNDIQNALQAIATNFFVGGPDAQ
ncbi:MAG TPA: thrombospondin type 3 repeat-containing protein [Kiritimatiellia bacterium]|nr:thrombospondin type 3 repeat-containing protein [Kiritimatiellia bacterium]HMP00579.1 thrombospondin type 3 repeat-containing protein [Kiritimatiellia bacterium]